MICLDGTRHNGGNRDMKKLCKKQEAEGQAWFMKAIEIMDSGDSAAFQKHMDLANNNYYNGYVILTAIGLVTDSAVADIRDIALHPEIKVDIISQSPLAFGLKSRMANVNFLKLTTIAPFTSDGIPNQQRQGDCHGKAFELASKCSDNVRLVTALVSTLSDIHTYLHSWVEDDDSGCAYDYTMNSAYDMQTYRTLLNAQTPLSEIGSKDIKSGKITYNAWAKMIHELYE